METDSEGDVRASGSIDETEPLVSVERKEGFVITIEPVLFLILFASAFTDSVITNVVETRVCLVWLHLPEMNCTRVDPQTQSLIQPSSVRLLLVKSLLESTFPAILSFFIGPWSDMNGRKPFLLTSLGGCCLSYLVWLVLSIISQASPYWFLVSAFSVAFTGGYVATFSCCFCYIGDITKENNRAIRMAFTQSSLMLGILTGYLLVPKVYKASNGFAPQIVFIIAAGAAIFSFLYVLFFLPETIDKNKMIMRRSLFNFGHVKDLFGAIFMKRRLHGRTVILLFITLCATSISVMMGESSIRYMSLQEKYSWTLPQYTRFSSLLSFVGACTSLFGMFFLTRVMGFSDLAVAVLAIFLLVVSELLVALSTSSLFFIIAANIGCFGVLIGPVVRTELSKVVEKKDLGKVFAFLSSMEAVLPLCVSPIYNLVYSAVLSTSPLSVYFLSFGFSVINFLLLMVISVIHCIYGKPYFKHLKSADLIRDEIEDGSSSISPTPLNS